ncbi:MAG: hypothetical protein GPJ54_14725 [Candidatus Heimdallarchaeota archaeon]|nr:hypothetical protein [Candidatus Heimdallarchaeota archaeon]
MEKDFTYFDERIHSAYYSPVDDIPFWLTNPSTLNLSESDHAQITNEKGAEAMRERFKIYHRTIFHNVEINNLFILTGDNDAMAQAQMRNPLGDTELLTTWMWRISFAVEDGKTKIISAFAIYDLMPQLVKRGYLELHSGKTGEKKSLEQYVEKLRSMGVLYIKDE